MFCPTVCEWHMDEDHCWPIPPGDGILQTKHGRNCIERKVHQYYDLTNSCACSHHTTIITLEILLKGLPQHSQVSAAVKLLEAKATDRSSFECDIRHVVVSSYIWHLYKTSVTEFCMACHCITEIHHQGSAGISKLCQCYDSRGHPIGAQRELLTVFWLTVTVNQQYFKFKCNFAYYIAFTLLVQFSVRSCCCHKSPEGVMYGMFIFFFHQL